MYGMGTWDACAWVAYPHTQPHITCKCTQLFKHSNIMWEHTRAFPLRFACMQRDAMAAARTALAQGGGMADQSNQGALLPTAVTKAFTGKPARGIRWVSSTSMPVLTWV